MSMAVGDRDENEPMMDMNTTPLIDVMLVLLIMFIITLPIQTHAVKIDLPTPNPNPSNIEPDKNKVFVTPEGKSVGESFDQARRDGPAGLAQVFDAARLVPDVPFVEGEHDALA